MVLSVCKYDKNKITYEHEHVILSEDDIILTLSDSKILVLVDDFFYSSDFVRKKYLRFFSGEKYNQDKTTYIIWNLNTYGYVFNIDNICKKLPLNIIYFKFNNYYNNEPRYLPPSITHIFFGSFFNSSVDCLKCSIEYLHFGKEFNTPIDNLPGNLKKLLFVPWSKFNQSLDNLPNFLEYLFLPSEYSKTIDNLPNFLSHIDINSSYEHALNNLPNSIEKIIFYSFDKQKNKILINDNYVPELCCYYNPDVKIGTDLKIYNIDKIFGKLPINLKYLDLTFSYKLNLFSDFVNYQISEKNIHVKKDYVKKSQPLDNLPEGLRVLKFPANYNLIQIDKIPQNIVKLFLSNTFNQSVDKLLNPNFLTGKSKPQTKLTYLLFGCKFNNMVNYLPDSLEYLYFGHDFNKPVDNLPSSLVFVRFGNNFNCSINNLPPNLKNIEFGMNFSQSLNYLGYGIETISFPTKLMHNKSNGSYGYNTIINKLPYSIKKIYFPKSICYDNYVFPKEYNISPVFDQYKHLIEYY